MVSAVLYGGLGNQLFIKAATIAHALRNNFDYEIPKTVTNPHVIDQQPYIFPGVKYCDDDHSELNRYNEPYFHYSPIPQVDDILLAGYWQSEKYFSEFRDEIIEMFGMEITRILQGWCGIHVRRGDYLRWSDFHPPVGINYLYGAIAEVSKKLNIKNFLVASDDVKWCKENLLSNSNNFEFIESGNEIEDLKQIASCCHQIGSNSSYSWWAHYLNPNPNKVGVFPRKWFGPSLRNNTKDLYLNSMILL